MAREATPRGPAAAEKIFRELPVGAEFQFPAERGRPGWGRCRKVLPGAFTSGDQFLHRPHDLVFDAGVYRRAQGGLAAAVRPPTRREGWGGLRPEAGPGARPGANS